MLDTLIRSAESYLSTLNKERLESAYRFAEKAHEGQLRKDGSPYISHPLAAAEILTRLHVDEDTLVACLLHDVPEDTSYNLEDIEEAFGADVRFLVEGITKLSKVYYRNNMEERQIESLKKLLLHCAKDPRVILIKLADRLHNMMTLSAIPVPEKRERIARETLEIYVPIANLLSIWELKSQLEDYCFKVLNPEAYQKIHEKVQAFQTEKKTLMQNTVTKISELLQAHGVNFKSVEGRQKTFFSTYQKMMSQQKEFEEIYDFVGVRVLVEDIGSCYQVLGVIHQNFTPKMGRLKDYIAIPKSNGYQSIHTTVFGLEGVPTEIQIRTYDMHLENEYGIAAHYFYREGQSENKGVQSRLKKKHDWVERILDLQRKSESNEHFMKDLKVDVFEDRIFVFTPKGDVVDLPKGAGVLDFAFHVHTHIGESAISARINGKNTDLFADLKNGDVVFVNTDPESAGPQVSWIHQVKTNMAKNRIKDYLKAKDRAMLMEASESLLASTLSFFGMEEEALSPAMQSLLLDEFQKPTWEQFLLSLGEGNLDLNEIVTALDKHFSLLGEEFEVHHLTAYQGEHHDLQAKKFRHVSLLISARDRLGLLADVSQIFGSLGINILDMHVISNSNEHVEMKLQIELHSSHQYERALRSLKEMVSIEKIQRLA